MLLSRLNELNASEVFACKHALDDRYHADAIVSHSGQAFPAVSVRSIHEMIRYVEQGTRYVAIDEAHFFDDSLLGVVESLAVRGVDVLLTALDRDSWGRPFPVIERLCTMADESPVLQATCAKCRQPADRTQRLTPIINGYMVGGAESYEPRCQRCWRPPPETAPQ